jgi:SHS2 domain-containing protein
VSTAEQRKHPVSGHELVDHTSEVTLHLYAPTFAALVAEATRAFGKLVPDSLKAGGPSGDPREIWVQALDRAGLLVGWLNEMIYLAEADSWLPIEVSAFERDPGLHVTARGTPLRKPFVFVKAATLHRAVVRKGPLGLEAEVTLDV